MHPALLYLPGERLTHTELSAARLDGDVIELGECYIPADLIDSPDVRASAIKHLLRTGMAATGPTAAWIHGAATSPPAVHHARRATERRLRRTPDARMIFHDTLLPASDAMRVGPLWVTTPVRTLFDLAIGADSDPTMANWLHHLSDAMPQFVPDASEYAEQHGRSPGIRRARAILRTLATANQDEVTR